MVGIVHYEITGVNELMPGGF